MAEIAKINKVNIYQESLGKKENGDPFLSYTEVGQASIGTDIDIKPTINSGSLLIKGAETQDDSIQLGITNGITATAEGGLIANSVTANKLILENGNNDIDIKNALKSVSLTVTSNNGLVVTGTTLNGDETASSEASITFPESTDEKVEVVEMTSGSHPLLLGKQYGEYIGEVQSSPSNVLYYDPTQKALHTPQIFIGNGTQGAVGYNGTIMIFGQGNSGNLRIDHQNILRQGGALKLSSTVGTALMDSVEVTGSFGCDRLSRGGVLYSNDGNHAPLSGDGPHLIYSKQLSENAYSSLEKAVLDSKRRALINNHGECVFFISSRYYNTDQTAPFSGFDTFICLLSYLEAGGDESNDTLTYSGGLTTYERIGLPAIIVAKLELNKQKQLMLNLYASKRGSTGMGYNYGKLPNLYHVSALFYN